MQIMKENESPYRTIAVERASNRHVELLIGYDSDKQMYESSACYPGPAPREPVDNSYITDDDPRAFLAALSGQFEFEWPEHLTLNKDYETQLY